MTNSNKNYLSIKEFISLAGQFEKDSAEFYKKLQEQDLSDPVRELAVLLERQELSHQKILLEYEAPDETAYIQFAPEFTLMMPVLDKEKPTVREFIELAIAREIKAREIYENAETMAKGDFRDLIHGLAIFEKEHEQKLKSIRDYY